LLLFFDKLGKEKEIRKKIDWSNKKEVNQALILDRMLLSETPDEIKDDIGQIDFLKCDVEGGEYKIFDNMKQRSI
tara:strand:- start:83 stop:307 length:225 start_codon:yes stop_codon:yes gene_type:complete